MRQRLESLAFPGDRMIDFSHLRRIKTGRQQRAWGKLRRMMLSAWHGMSVLGGPIGLAGTATFVNGLLDAIRANDLALPAAVLVCGDSSTVSIDGPAVCNLAEADAQGCSVVAYGAEPPLYQLVASRIHDRLGGTVELVDLGSEADLKRKRYPYRRFAKVPFLAGMHGFVGPTRRCNLRCKYCLHTEPQNLPADMSQQSFRQILEKLNGHVVELTLSAEFGEPLLHADLPDLISMARDVIPFIAISTNGTLLKPQTSLKLAAAGLSEIRLSLDSLDPEYNQQMRGITTEQILDNIEWFSRFTGIPVRVVAVVTTKNLDKVAALPSLKKRIPTLDSVALIPMTAVTPDSLTGVECMAVHSLDEFRDEYERFRAACKRYGVQPAPITDLEHMGRVKTHSCVRPWDAVYVNVEANLVTCSCGLTRDDMVVASMLEEGTTLKELYNRPRFIAHRRAGITGALPRCCQACEYSLSLER
jgi:MoaA/NifB/PqqE/SkfB family radical SAM enzyme